MPQEAGTGGRGSATAGWIKDYLAKRAINQGMQQQQKLSAQAQREELKALHEQHRQRMRDKSLSTVERAQAMDGMHRAKEKLDEASPTRNLAKKVGSGALNSGRKVIKLGISGASAGRRVIGEAQKNNINIYFIIAVLFHLYDGFTNFSQDYVRITFFFFMGILGWLWIFKESAPVISQQSLQGLGKSMGIALAAYLLPMIIMKYLGDGILDRNLFSIILAAFPVYVVWFCFIEPVTPMLIKWQKALIFLWLTIAIFWVFTAAKAGSIQIVPFLQNNTEIDFLGAWANILKMFWEAVKGIWEALKKMFEQMVTGIRSGVSTFKNQTMGQLDVYTGKVDSNAEEKLGVYLEQLKSSSTQYYNGDHADPINVWATLVARTLEREIKINVGCWMAVTKKGLDGKASDYTIPADIIYPYNQFAVYEEGETQEDIDCLFTKETVKQQITDAGTFRAYMSATFNFETRAYIKSYFIDREKSLAMKRENIDPLKQFGINDKNPMAIYTNGPIMIGMDQKKVPFELNQENMDQNTFTLGITLKNKWDGEIIKINRVRVIMPKEITIVDNMCSGIMFKEGSCTGMDLDCDDIFHNFYEMDEAVAGSISKEKTFRCPLRVEDPTSLLGDMPIATKYFKVAADYEYRFNKSTSIRVKKGIA